MNALRPRVSGYVGGRSPNWYERQAALKRNVHPLPAVDLGWQHQCRCGETTYTLWRKKWVCRKCGRWVLAARIAEVDAERKSIGQYDATYPRIPQEPPA